MCILVTGPFDTGIWYNTQTCNLFNMHKTNIQEGLKGEIERLDEMIKQRDVTLILSKPHDTMKDERLPESIAHDIMT